VEDKMDLEKNWKSLKEEVSKTWSKLTEDDLEKISGKKDELIETLKDKYKWTKDEVQE